MVHVLIVSQEMKYIIPSITLFIGLFGGWFLHRNAELREFYSHVDATGMTIDEWTEMVSLMPAAMETEDRMAALIALHGVRLIREEEMDRLSRHLIRTVAGYYYVYGPSDEPAGHLSSVATEEIRSTLEAIEAEMEINPSLDQAVRERLRAGDTDG